MWGKLPEKTYRQNFCTKKLLSQKTFLSENFHGENFLRKTFTGKTFIQKNFHRNFQSPTKTIRDRDGESVPEKKDLGWWFIFG